MLDKSLIPEAYHLLFNIIKFQLIFCEESLLLIVFLHHNILKMKEGILLQIFALTFLIAKSACQEYFSVGSDPDEFTSIRRRYVELSWIPIEFNNAPKYPGYQVICPIGMWSCFDYFMPWNNTMFYGPYSSQVVMEKTFQCFRWGTWKGSFYLWIGNQTDFFPVDWCDINQQNIKIRVTQPTEYKKLDLQIVEVFSAVNENTFNIRKRYSNSKIYRIDFQMEFPNQDTNLQNQTLKFIWKIQQNILCTWGINNFNIFNNPFNSNKKCQEISTSKCVYGPQQYCQKCDPPTSKDCQLCPRPQNQATCVVQMYGKAITNDKKLKLQNLQAKLQRLTFVPQHSLEFLNTPTGNQIENVIVEIDVLDNNNQFVELTQEDLQEIIVKVDKLGVSNFVLPTYVSKLDFHYQNYAITPYQFFLQKQLLSFSWLENGQKLILKMPYRNFETEFQLYTLKGRTAEYLELSFVFRIEFYIRNIFYTGMDSYIITNSLELPLSQFFEMKTQDTAFQLIGYDFHTVSVFLEGLAFDSEIVAQAFLCYDILCRVPQNFYYLSFRNINYVKIFITNPSILGQIQINSIQYRLTQGSEERFIVIKQTYQSVLQQTEIVVGFTFSSYVSQEDILTLEINAGLVNLDSEHRALSTEELQPVFIQGIGFKDNSIVPADDL